MNLLPDSRRAFLGAFVATFLAYTAQAAPMHVYLQIDPPATAFSGIPPAGGFSGFSNRSGAGTWHLFATDDVTGSFGIRNYAITLTPVTAISHRSPTTSWDDDPVFGNGTGPFAAGFSDARSGPSVNPIVAGQAVTNVPQIGGYGRATSNFQAKIPGAQSYAGTVSGQWGKHCDACKANALFIAEGLYSGLPPVVTAATVGYYTNPQLTTFAIATSYSFLDPNANCPEPAALTLLALATIGGTALIRRRRR